MRIVAGAWRGRPLAAPPGEATRPSADRLRQSLFDRLAHAPWAAGALRGSRVLDAFAGTGALGLEALSRGAAHATFLETARPALDALRRNVTALGAADRAAILPRDARSPPPGTPCDLLFLDPPYHAGLAAPALTALQRAGWLAPGALVILETAQDEPPPGWGDPVDRFTAGAGTVTIWRLA